MSLRIVFVLSSLTLSGGVMLVVECANRLAQRGHQIALVAPKAAVDDDALNMLDSRVQVVEATVGLPARRSPLALVKLILALARAAPPAHILIATHTPTTLPTLLASLGQRTARRAWLYMDYPEMFRQRPLEQWLLRWAPRWFPLILPISHPLAQAVLPTARGQVHVLTPGLSRSELFFAKPNAVTENQEIRILYIGDERPRKGLADFLAATKLAARQISPLRLVVVSKQPCVVESHLPVEFHLHPGHAELADLYRGSQLYVSASWGEGLGYPPLEAMACGVPVVLTDSEGVRDYAQDGVNCLMTPPHNPQALAQAIVRVIKEPALAARLVANGLLTAKRYDWGATIAHLEELLAAQLENV